MVSSVVTGSAVDVAVLGMWVLVVVADVVVAVVVRGEHKTCLKPRGLIFTSLAERAWRLAKAKT